MIVPENYFLVMRGRKKWEDFSRVGGGSPKFFGPAGRRGVLSAPDT